MLRKDLDDLAEPATIYALVGLNEETGEKEAWLAVSVGCGDNFDLTKSIPPSFWMISDPKRDSR